MKVDRSLDCRGMFCPLPIAKAKVEIDNMKSGEILEVIADDPASKRDFESWCKATSNKLISFFEEDSSFKFYIEKS